MAAIASLLAFAVILIAGPIVAASLGHPLGGITSAIMMVSGIGLLLFSGIMMTITKLYVKTKASEAFVRTGMSGMRVIKDGGSIVIPVIHQIVKISLRTMRLDVGREGPDALITKDKLRADIKAEFFVRVMPDDASIQNAARSFGEHMDDGKYVSNLIEDKLISALRTIAATKTLAELNTQRDEFVAQVTSIVTTDLAHNGLTLEVATISRLDQTAVHNLSDDNVFDAEGKRTIAEITQRQLTERNELERNGEQTRMEKDVATRQRMLELARQQAEAEADQEAQIAITRAAKTREAQEKQIEATQAVDIANVSKAQAIEVAQRGQQQAVEVAERAKQQAIVEADKNVEVAERNKQAAIADAEAGRVTKEAELAKAEAERETQRQAITTVQVTAEAERAKTTMVMAAQADAERTFTAAQRAADGEAYSMKTKAEGQKAAVEAEAEAITKKAQAEAAAAEARARGEQASAMVPVLVKQAEVDIEAKRVGVLQQELEARATHGAAAQNFELAKLRITKEAEIRIEGARAAATFGGKIEATVVGTPEDVARLNDRFLHGMGIARTFNGFFEGADTQTLDSVTGIGQEVANFLRSTAQRIGAKPEDIVSAASTALDAQAPK